MKRILIDHRKLDHALTTLLITTYPDGYGDNDIIAFKNHKGEYIEAVELRTAEALYLVKISQSLSHFIANYEEDHEDDLDSEERISQVTEEPELELNLESELEGDELE